MLFPIENEDPLVYSSKAQPRKLTATVAEAQYVTPLNSLLNIESNAVLKPAISEALTSGKASRAAGLEILVAAGLRLVGFTEPGLPRTERREIGACPIQRILHTYLRAGM